MNISKTGALLGLVAAMFGMASMPIRESIGIRQTPLINDSTTVWEVYEKLGKIKLHQVNPAVQGASAQKGRELVEKGYTTNLKGKKTAVQSAFFKCTACHNTTRESHDWIKMDADSRLAYSIKTKTPYLQGSTFYGIVNRVSFYNDDYQKKYASVPDIVAAKNDIRKAIYVCATQCSQGRVLEDWEMESVLLYFWELQLKIGDLSLSEEERAKIEMAFNDGTSSARAIHLIKDEFEDKSPAHFVETPKYKPLQDSELKDKARFMEGKAVYELSCQHCHAAKRYSFYLLDNSRSTFKYLSGKMDKYGKHSVYQTARHGTAPIVGQKAYMPQYTIERLSENQLENLRVYIDAMAKGFEKEIDN